MVYAWQRHVAPAARTLGGSDQVLRGEQAERLAYRRAAHTELAGQRVLSRQSLAPRELAADDQPAELVRDLLVGLANAMNRHRARRPLHGSQPAGYTATSTATRPRYSIVSSEEVTSA